MKLFRRSHLLTFVVLCACAIAGWSFYQAQAAPTHPLDQLMPEGAMLYIEGKDFGSLLKEWNASPEQARWLKSDDYRVFSNSRLFLRLRRASDEFAKAAGVPPDARFLNDAAGRESALAIYDIGKLEFLYITHLSSGNFLQSALWQSRSKFESRTSAGRPFFTRKDPESDRVVAFAVADNYAVLGTREDLVAGALELMVAGNKRNLHQEAWYTQALAAAPPSPGDLRMVQHLETIARTPHFRTYWIQQNITDMQGYLGAVCDLYREGAVYREERVLLPAKPQDDAALAQTSQAVSALTPLLPRDYGFYRVSGTDAKESLAVAEEKLLAPHFAAAAPPEKVAPEVQLTGGQTGSASDLETRIDVEPPARAAAGNNQALRRQFTRAAPQALLVAQSTRKNQDGVLLNFPTLVVIAGAGDWDLAAVQQAIQAELAPALTASGLGLDWREVKDAGGFYQLDGLTPLLIARREKLLFLANDAALLTAALQPVKVAPGPALAYVAGFSHARERQNFFDFTRLVDQNAAATQPQLPFFSRNLSSFSRAFSRVESEEVRIKRSKDKIQQTVTYHWSP
ncbi:MAG TPA: hypothetical protein VFL42_13840 [Terriglobales bacterium]|nr:hypothetical protein [Terriglobales bacterium]